MQRACVVAVLGLMTSPTRRQARSRRSVAIRSGTASGRTSSFPSSKEPSEKQPIPHEIVGLARHGRRRPRPLIEPFARGGWDIMRAVDAYPQGTLDAISSRGA